MSRLANVRRATGSRLRRVNVAGVTRVVVAAGAAVGLVHLATSEPLELDLVAATGQTQAPVAGTALATRAAAVCPGPELTGIPGLTDVRVKGTVSVAAAPTDVLPVPTTRAGRLAASAGAKSLLSLDTRPSDRTVRLPAKGAVRLTAEGAMAPAVAATQEWRLAGKDLRGLATTPCSAGGPDLWLLGGGAGPGRLERLVLSNPGDNPVTADITIHGAGGPLGDPMVQTVAPGGRVSLLLDARTGAEERPAVHVRASGGVVHATLTDTWVSGSTALGAETVAPTASPGTVQVIPGAVLGSGPASLRVAVPGDQEAVVRVSVLARDGLVPLKGDTVLTVGAGSVGDLPIEGAPEGTYAVAVRSDVPVVAAVLSRVGDGTEPSDFAWSVSAGGVSSVAGSALAASQSIDRTLHLISTGGNSSAMVTVMVEGTPRTRRLDLLPDRLATVPLDGASAVWVERLTGSGELRGTVLSTSGTGSERLVSSMPLQESAVRSPVSRAFPLP
jgi:hypothetical protein